MSDSISIPSSLRAWSPQASRASSQPADLSNNTGVTNNDFQQLLTTLLIGLAMPGITGDGSQNNVANILNNGTSTGESSGIANLMAPLMLSLLEQLLARQLGSSDSASADLSSTGQSLSTIQPAVQEVENAALKTIDPSSTPKGRPVQGPITQYSHSGHVALDIGIPTGASIQSTMDGKVIYAGWNNEGYGNLVIVENGPYKTYYAHLSKVPVKVGDTVKAKDVIGISGSTGNSTGPHLHYEVRKNNTQIDPTDFTLH